MSYTNFYTFLAKTHRRIKNKRLKNFKNYNQGPCLKEIGVPNLKIQSFTSSTIDVDICFHRTLGGKEWSTSKVILSYCICV